MGNKFKKIQTASGAIIEVDISDEACEKFGFKHGDRIVDEDDGDEGIVEGVYRKNREDVLYISSVMYDGAMFYTLDDLKDGKTVHLKA